MEIDLSFSQKFLNVSSKFRNTFYITSYLRIFVKLSTRDHQNLEKYLEAE